MDGKGPTSLFNIVEARCCIISERKSCSADETHGLKCPDLLYNIYVA